LIDANSSPPPPLGQLYLGNNRIRRLPSRSASWFAPLAKSLAELDLQGNGLEELPIEVRPVRERETRKRRRRRTNGPTHAPIIASPFYVSFDATIVLSWIQVAFCQSLKLLDLTNNDLRDLAFTLGETAVEAFLASAFCFGLFFFISFPCTMPTINKQPPTT
jgi:Leucine-rich repeat (LRR) protein